MKSYKIFGIIAIALVGIMVIMFAGLSISSNGSKKYKIDDSNAQRKDFDNSEISSILLIKDIDQKSFTSYNIDKKTGEDISKEDLLKRFGYDTNYVVEKIDDRLKSYYSEEVDEGYVDPNECDFSCYKKTFRNIENYDYALIVKDEKLYVYLSFDVNSLVDDQEYFDDLDYNPYEIKL